MGGMFGKAAHRMRPVKRKMCCAVFLACVMLGVCACGRTAEDSSGSRAGASSGGDSGKEASSGSVGDSGAGDSSDGVVGSGNLPAEGAWSTGRYLRGRGDTNLIIFSGIDACEMRTGNDNVSFEAFESGDLIQIYYNSIQETWPGQVTVYAAEKLEDGEIGDIDPECLEQLREFQWIE